MLTKSKSLRCWAGMAALLAGLGAAARAQADGMYSYLYVTGQSSYVAGTNQDVVIPLYLQETSLTPGSSLLVNELGLASAGVSVADTSATPTLSSAQITALAGNPAFDLPEGTTVNLSPATNAAAMTELPWTSVMPGPQDAAGISSVFLGDLTVHTGGVAGQTTRFTVGSMGVSDVTATTLSNYDLDTTLPGTYYGAAGTKFDVETSDVPEPGTLALSATGAVVLCIYSRLRRRGRRLPLASRQCS
jgi:hypothetical protein